MEVRGFEAHGTPWSLTIHPAAVDWYLRVLYLLDYRNNSNKYQNEAAACSQGCLKGLEFPIWLCTTLTLIKKIKHKNIDRDRRLRGDMGHALKPGNLGVIYLDYR